MFFKTRAEIVRGGRAENVKCGRELSADQKVRAEKPRLRKVWTTKTAAEKQQKRLRKVWTQP
jgi:hypothetical protein